MRKQSPATVDGSNSSPEAAPRPFLAPAHPAKVRLATIDDTRREMAAVYRQCRAGTLDTRDGTRLVYILSELVKAFLSQDVEARVKALEQLENTQ